MVPHIHSLFDLSLEILLVGITFGYLELLYSATFFTIRMIHFFYVMRLHYEFNFILQMMFSAFGANFGALCSPSNSTTLQH